VLKYTLYKTIGGSFMNRRSLLTFQRCNDMFRKAKLCSKIGEKAVRLENNTYLTRNTDHYSVLLHWTDVVDIYPDKWVVRHGGWMTKTTKDRIEKYAPISITQRSWLWYVHGEDFQNGMEVTKEDILEQLI
jgi:hypothetical protein